MSVWQHVKLSGRIWDTLACCWDVKQPTIKNIRQGRRESISVSVRSWGESLTTTPQRRWMVRAKYTHPAWRNSCLSMQFTPSSVGRASGAITAHTGRMLGTRAFHKVRKNTDASSFTRATFFAVCAETLQGCFASQCPRLLAYTRQTAHSNLLYMFSSAARRSMRPDP